MVAKPAAAKPTEKTSKIEGKKPRETLATTEAGGKKAPPFRSKYKPEQIITLLVDYNPKRVGSAAHASFDHYEDGMTVKDFLESGGLSISLGWDVDHGFIKIGDTFDAKAKKQSKPEKAPKPKKAKKEEAEDEDEDEDE